MSAIKRHVLVPKHQKLSDKEKSELFSHYHISLKELPVILATDPAVESLGVVPDDVVKITRPSVTAKEAIFYRRVSHA